MIVLLDGFLPDSAVDSFTSLTYSHVSCGNRAARSGMWPSYGMKWDEEPFPFSPPSTQLMKTRPISRLSLHGCEFVTKFFLFCQEF